MVPKSMAHNIREILQESGIPFSVMLPDVQKLIDEQSAKMAGRVAPTSLADFDYSIYHTYEEVRVFKGVLHP